MFAHLTASISIHALVKRATKLENVYNNKPIYFNPRPREEGDKRKIFLGKHNAISIHALVKRATNIADSGRTEKTYFNPRPREEGDYSIEE